MRTAITICASRCWNRKQWLPVKNNVGSLMCRARVKSTSIHACAAWVTSPHLSNRSLSWRSAFRRYGSTDIAQPILALFDREYGVRSVRDHVVITQQVFSDDITRNLALETDAIGLVLEQTVFDDMDRPISSGYQYWRGDIARFSADLKY